MEASRLRVVLAENGLTEMGLTLRSLCAEAGKILELVRVGEGNDLKQALRVHCPDVALLKLALLQPDAAEQLRVLQENSPSIPLILLVEPADNVSVETCVALGAADYLVEGYLDERTLRRVLCATLGKNWTTTGGTYRTEAWLATEARAQVFAEVAKALRRVVRSTDEIEAVSEYELLAVRMRNVDESRRDAVRRRLEARLTNDGFPVLGEFGPAVRIVEASQSVWDEGVRFAVIWSGEGTAVQSEAGVC